MAKQQASDLGSAPRGSRTGKVATDMETDAIVGTLTHQLVARFLDIQATLEAQGDTDVPTALIEAGASLVAAVDGLGSHRSRVRLRVITSAGQYFHRFRPPATVTFLGTEVNVREGVVDIAWQHPTLGVFFDELKTSRRCTGPISPDVDDQLRRYARSGADQLGDRFIGVRYIPLLNPAGSMLVGPRDGDITMTPLSATPLWFTERMEGAA